FLFIVNDFAAARYLPDGRLDATFGDGGLAAVGFSEYSNDVLGDLLVQADGRIVLGGITVPQDPAGDSVLGDVALARLTAGGTVDATFGDGGRVVGGGARPRGP